MRILTRLLLVALAGSFSASCARLPHNTNSKYFLRQCRDISYVAPRCELQLNSEGCGIACVTAIIQHWGGNATQRELIANHPVPRGGYSMGTLCSILEAHGLYARIVKLPRKETIEQVLKGRPVLCAIKRPNYEYQIRQFSFFHGAAAMLNFASRETSHFSLLCGYSETRRTYLVMDPAVGYRIIPRFEFDEWRKPYDHAAILAAPVANP